MERLTYQKSRAIALLAGLATLAACGEQGSGGQWFREAGAQVDSGEFGAATMQNMVAQTCKTSGFGAGKAGGKLGTVGDPVVVLDPSSTTSNPVYRIHCDGRLDGKYAEVIYREYVESATQKTITEDAEAE
ncbi:hypothetical protein [uncultured Roseobacter sp.]|uniref:hypothetical protein n=1 Tax=uncultured Roseobacter sp. TaxID=114847 RepID=UPI0026104163|nr:hypothetical protein [uncultured Roseobacter sp.]